MAFTPSSGVEPCADFPRDTTLPFSSVSPYAEGSPKEASAEAVHKSHTIFARSPPLSSANFAPFTVNLSFKWSMPFSA